jgi:pyruvate/2-oxoglutarate dehydrogenase complex dihydrolipoamide dehydrogenase (E3) component
MQMDTLDAIVIGAGQAGGPLVGALAKAGKKTAMIEEAYVGGTCINYGCTPTKTMVASAGVADEARRSAQYGVHTGEVLVDLREVRARKTGVVERFRKSSLSGIESSGAELIRGQARFLSKNTLEVRLNEGGTRQVTANLIFINTGARPSIPDLPGLSTVPYLDSTSIMELGEIPERLLILGGGYVGLEFAQMFRRFGSQVTIVQRGSQLLPIEDEDVAQGVLQILQEDGIRVLLDATATSVVLQSSGEIRLNVRAKDGDQALTGTHLLVAVGRQPNSEALDLPAVGVAKDSRGFIQVNERLETTIPGIYALGDVKGGPAFTHISYDDYRIVKTNLLEGGSASTRGRMVPYTVFIDPQLGRVGLTERQARETGRKLLVGTYPMEYVARAIETGNRRGFMKAIVDAESQQILGAAILGYEGGETVQLIEVAMMGKLPYTALRDGIFTHPTLAESLNSLFSSLAEK